MGLIVYNETGERSLKKETPWTKFEQDGFYSGI